MIRKKHPTAKPAIARRLSGASAKSSASLAVKSLAKRESRLLLREKAADLREVADATRTDASARTGEQLRDVNERLVVATVKAQTMADAGARAGEQLRNANERLVVATVKAQTMADAAEQSAARMTHMAEHDVLTGLPNRALLTARLEQAIALAQRHGNRVGLMYLDLDHFKHINDSLGHTIGDQLLQSTAKRLQACVRHSDTVSRQGGDEFVVLLAEVETERDVVVAAEKLLEAMVKVHHIGVHSLHITLSIGISLYPEDGKDTETLVKNADTAMYHAKSSGRNNYQRFAPDMNDREVARQAVEDAMRQGLERRDFVLHYQPKVNLETGAITGAEALVRLHTEYRLVYPTEFVSIAEDCGMIVPIGRWVLREACRQTVAWLKDGLKIGQIAVNVSSVEFHNKHFLAGVLAILNETSLDPRHLELELTESGLMLDTEITLATLRELKALGVRVAIDDFGTGYSSLSYLRRFAIDTLKIDQSFVQDLDADESIIGAIIAMGQCLKQRVIAEGVETMQQHAFLKSHFCTEGQGYYFSRPVAAEEFAVLLRTDRH